jgi:prophage regulatory protein
MNSPRDNVRPDAATPSRPPAPFLRLGQIIGRGGLIPISRASWYDGIRRGVFPAPVKIGRSSLWDTDAVFALIERLKTGGTPIEDVEHSGKDKDGAQIVRGSSSTSLQVQAPVAAKLSGAKQGRERVRPRR